MFREYALDPSLIRDWASFDRFVNRFSWADGRVLSCIPLHWEREAIQSLRIKGAKRTTVVERLRKVKKWALWRNNIAQDSNGNWYNIARAEHERKNFASVISEKRPEDHTWVIRGDDFDAEDERFKVHGKASNRDPGTYTRLLHLLLYTAEYVHFIDPYFNPNESRFSEPLVLLLQIVCGDSIFREELAKPYLHVYLGDLQKMTPDEVSKRRQHKQTELQKVLPGLVPKGHELHVIIWTKLAGGEKIHNRYILTDKAGVLFGIGLDCSDEGTGHDDILRLPRELHKERLALYDVTASGVVNAKNEDFEIIKIVGSV